MKCRQVSFYVEQSEIPLVMETVVHQVLPQYQVLPHFLGATVIKSDRGERAEVVATSYWDDGLEGSDEESSRFIEEISRVTGQNPSRKMYDILYAEVRDSNGALMRQ
jgi:hypothetical protein